MITNAPAIDSGDGWDRARARSKRVISNFNAYRSFARRKWKEQLSVVGVYLALKRPWGLLWILVLSVMDCCISMGWLIVVFSSTLLPHPIPPLPNFKYCVLKSIKAAEVTYYKTQAVGRILKPSAAKSQIHCSSWQNNLEHRPVSWQSTSLDGLLQRQRRQRWRMWRRVGPCQKRCRKKL